MAVFVFAVRKNILTFNILNVIIIYDNCSKIYKKET